MASWEIPEKWKLTWCRWGGEPTPSPPRLAGCLGAKAVRWPMFSGYWSLNKVIKGIIIKKQWYLCNDVMFTWIHVYIHIYIHIYTHYHMYNSICFCYLRLETSRQRSHLARPQGKGPKGAPLLGDARDPSCEDVVSSHLLRMYIDWLADYMHI